ncbi:hypothetical protein ACL1FZ_12420 [Corynebacterium striatum]
MVLLALAGAALVTRRKRS